jgi:hypothetical protein
VATVGASSNHTCAMCPTVVMDKTHPSLLGHHSSDETITMDRLPVAKEGYEPLIQKYCSSVIPAGGAEDPQDDDNDMCGVLIQESRPITKLLSCW